MRRLFQLDAPRGTGIAVAIATFAVVMLLSALGRLQGTENSLLRMRFEARGTRNAGPAVILVTLEEGSTLAGPGALPWSRERLAGLVDRLDRAGASVIGLDIAALAGEVIPPEEPDGDDILADAMRRHGRVVLPLSLIHI